MKINVKNSIVSSVILIVITFFIMIIILSFTKPFYIMEVDKKGKKLINWYLLISISVLFGILSGLIKFMFFLKSEYRPTNNYSNLFAYTSTT